MGISLKHRTFRTLLNIFEKSATAISRDLYMKMAVEIVEHIDLAYVVETSKGPISFHCSSETARQRAEKMLEKEPDTLQWIDGFRPDDVLWDIGSNVGVFTLYAAVTAKARVVAFDPIPFNYAGLMRNVEMNRVHDRVMAFCLALSDKTRLDNLYVPAQATMTGGAGGTFSGTVDNYGETVESLYAQPTLGYTIDHLIELFELPFPNHLKMDIDGPADHVIRGALKTLGDERLRSAMIEMQPTSVPRYKEAYDYITSEMEKAGFRLTSRAGATPDASDDIETGVINHFFEKPGR